MVGFIFFLRFGRVITVITATWQFFTLPAMLVFSLVDAAFINVTADFACVFKPKPCLLSRHTPDNLPGNTHNLNIRYRNNSSSFPWAFSPNHIFLWHSLHSSSWIEIIPPHFGQIYFSLCCTKNAAIPCSFTIWLFSIKLAW